MAYNKFLSAFLFSLILCPAFITSEPLRTRLKFHGIKKISGESGTDRAHNSLIERACHGIGAYESDCVDTLNKATEKQKSSRNDLAFYTLKYVETNAANLSTAISSMAEEPELPPLLQSALSDCSEQYIPLDDLVEDAINAVVEKVYPDAKQFIEAAISNTEECDAGLKRDKLQEKAEAKDAGNLVAAKDLKEMNTFIKNMLSAALNLIPKNE